MASDIKLGYRAGMESRPRWGVLSTRAHLDPGALVPDLLLYDRLVFPEPTPEDLGRWAKNGWRPDVLRKCISDLGPLAHTIPWKKELRDEWGTRFEAMAALAREADGIAFGLTPSIIAMSAWRDVRGLLEEPVPPVAVAAFQSADEARALAAFQPGLADNGDTHRGVALLFRQCLAMPTATNSGAEGEIAFAKAINLSKSTDFQAARRALYDWEDGVAAQRWPVDAAIRALKERMIAHDGLVRSTFPQVAMHVAIRVVSVAGGAVAGAALAGPLGAMAGPLIVEGGRAIVSEGVEKLVELGSARLPRFKRIAEAKNDPGALLSMAIGALYRRDR